MFLPSSTKRSIAVHHHPDIRNRRGLSNLNLNVFSNIETQDDEGPNKKIKADVKTNSDNMNIIRLTNVPMSLSPAPSRSSAMSVSSDDDASLKTLKCKNTNHKAEFHRSRRAGDGHEALDDDHSSDDACYFWIE